MIETTRKRKLIRKNWSIIVLSSFLSHLLSRALSSLPLIISRPFFLTSYLVLFLAHLLTFFLTSYLLSLTLFFSPLIFYTFFPDLIYYLLSFLAFPSFITSYLFLSLPFSLINSFIPLRISLFSDILFFLSHIFHSYFINSFYFPPDFTPSLFIAFVFFNLMPSRVKFRTRQLPYDLSICAFIHNGGMQSRKRRCDRRSRPFYRLCWNARRSSIWKIILLGSQADNRWNPMKESLLNFQCILSLQGKKDESVLSDVILSSRKYMGVTGQKRWNGFYCWCLADIDAKFTGSNVWKS